MALVAMNAPGGLHKVMVPGVLQMRLFLGVEHLFQALQAFGHIGGVGPVGQVPGFDEQKDLVRGVENQHVREFAAQAFMHQIGVRVERDIGGVQAQILAPGNFLDVAVEQVDALGVAGYEFVEKVAGEKLGAEVALFFGFDEGGVDEDRGSFSGRTDNKAAGMCCLRPAVGAGTLACSVPVQQRVLSPAWP